MDVSMELDHKYAGVSNVMSGMLAQALCGIVPIWGNIIVYITSYLRQYDDTLTMSTTYTIFPFTILMGALFMQLGSYLIDKMHPKKQMLLASMSFVFALILAQYVTQFFLFVIVYGIIGFGYGMIYMLPLKNAWLFYPEQKGTISGLILSCMSIGAIVWIVLTTALVNPNNESPTIEIDNGSSTEWLFTPDSDVVKNVPIMLKQLAIIYICLAVIATLLISKKKESPLTQLREPLIQDTIYSISSYRVNDSKAPIEEKTMCIRKLLKQKVFWKIFFMLTFSMSFSYFMKPSIKNYGSTKYNDDQFLTYVGILAFVMSSMAKFIWGVVQDHFGFVKVYGSLLCLQFLVCFTIEFASSNQILYCVWISLVFICEGGHFVMFPALASEIYGPTMGSKIYSLLFLGMALSANIGTLVSSFILPTWGWEVVFMFFGFLTIISGAILVVFSKKYNKYKLLQFQY